MINESNSEKISNLSLNFLPGALNSLSSRSASFTAPVERKKSINLFLRLLNSFDKNAKVP
jgi:hypothetical protein